MVWKRIRNFLQRSGGRDPFFINNTVQYSTVQYSTVQYSTVQYGRVEADSGGGIISFDTDSPFVGSSYWRTCVILSYTVSHSYVDILPGKR
jgi:hypothetical protein